MRLGVFSVIVGLCMSMTQAQAQSGPVLVELYTSQGCSSCPPADALLMELTKVDDVLPLAFHVDYWDYIGWPDNFGSAEYSARQREYARAAHRNMVYTPQMIIGGQSEVAGYKPMKVMDAIQAHRQLPSPVSLSISLTDDRLRIEAISRPTANDVQMQIILVRYQPHSSVNIRGGENAGKSVDYVNIVREWRPLAKWDGRDKTVMELSIPGDLPGAVLVQEEGPGAVLATARLR